MQFRIADTFTDSLTKLTGDEQKAAKTAAFDLQMDPAHPGLKLHQIDRAKDKDFWSARVSRDIRLIVHRTSSSFLLCYVDHHDAAYQWAARRRLERHPKTGAAQLVEIRETVREIRVPRYVEVDVPASSPGRAAGGAAASRTAIFADASDDDLLGYGVPVEWLDDVRAATEDTLLDLAGHLPGEAAEALLQLATGGTPDRPAPAAAGADPFAHPDAQRRFRVMADVEALQRALDSPWEKWTVFLHPAQRQLVEREYNGPARVSGSAGTGKTIVALHRAVHLARAHAESRVLLATFSDALAAALRARLRRLIGNEPKIAERLEVHSMHGIGRRLHAAIVGRLDLAADDDVRELLREAAMVVEGHRFGAHFLWTEWSTAVDAWQLASWEDYRDVPRLGRKTRLPEKQRELLCGPIRCGSTTARRTRSGDRPTGSCRPSWPTSTATRSGAARRSRCSTDRRPKSGRSIRRSRRPTPSRTGFARAVARVTRRRQSVCSSGRRRRSAGRCRRCRRRACAPSNSTPNPGACPGRSRSARCTSRRGWSAGRSQWLPATTRCSPCRPGSNGSATTPIWRRSTVPSGTCSTSPAPVRATDCW